MKSPHEIINAIPKPILEFFSFTTFVSAGSIFKMRKLQEKGIKITVNRFIVEAFMSFFIALVAYAVIDQWLHFNKLFTYAFCSVAGSMNDLIYSKMQELITACFDIAKKQLTK